MRTDTDKFPIASFWFKEKGWKAHNFQKNCWDKILGGYSGLLNAPTGYGKTYAIWFGILQQHFNKKKRTFGLHTIWITPLRALSKEILLATTRVSDDLGLDYSIGLRTGDTSTKERSQQKKAMPHALITTPESVHLMIAQKGYQSVFKSLEFVVVDEWHELLGSKRGVLIELALSRLKALNPRLRIWGISATIGNLEEAKEILLGSHEGKSTMIKANLSKKIEVKTMIPDTIDRYPWAGHLGIVMIDAMLDIIRRNTSTLIFTNTRSQCEIWYHRLLEKAPDLAGAIALHHGSLGEELRLWVEDALHQGVLKAVVCTSSLDLGVDFRPVDTVVQIGSPKGVARFMQRGGRSGHQPGATSVIHFLPTHSLEIIEGAALRYAIAAGKMEQRIPYIRCFDLLCQFLVTLAVSDGFSKDATFLEIKKTHCFSSITEEEFTWCVNFITQGGNVLDAYDEFHKVIAEDGIYKVVSRRVAMRHRLGIGAIVSESMINVQFVGGKRVGMVEEWFISRLNPGDAFSFAGNVLELVRIKDMNAYVRKSNNKKAVLPSWQGGRMPLSSQLSSTIRFKLNEFYDNKVVDEEVKVLEPLFLEQQRRSHLPKENEFLIEKVETSEGYHVFFFPFEGRYVHEGLSALFAYRLAQIKPMSFSIGFNDYGFELLSDQEIPLEEAILNGLFNDEHLVSDISKSLNITEMAKRKFRDIASIAGLVFNGFPGKQLKTRHLQASSQLFFSVFAENEANNLLLQQAYDEVMTFQMEQGRMLAALKRIQQQTVVVQYPEKLSPFSFPIFAERFREKLSNEKLEDRIAKMINQLEK